MSFKTLIYKLIQLIRCISSPDSRVSYYTSSKEFSDMLLTLRRADIREAVFDILQVCVVVLFS